MFEVDKLILIIIGTLVCFSWVFKYPNRIAKYFFFFMILLYLIYSGIGGALKDVSDEYLIFYFIFTICISLGIRFGLKVVKSSSYTSWIRWDNYLDYFINYKAKNIIIIYYCIKLLDLIFPEFKLLNLLYPPTPDLAAVMDVRYNALENSSVVSTILLFMSQLLYPFFLLALFKYRKQTLKLSLIVLGTYYINYCQEGYLGRGSMLEALIIIIAFTYFYRPKLGKYIIISSAILLPLLLIFLVQYSIKRIGGEVDNISAGDAIETLLSQESGYPRHFSEILKLRKHYMFNFLIWLFTMPLPGIFRGSIDVQFNAIFSELMLGIPRGAKGFYILLPGIVGESIFIFGKYLFWLNGLIYGSIIGISYKLLSTHKQLFGILIVVMIDCAYIANRGGLVSAVPFIFKILVYFYIILFLLKGQYYNKLKNILLK